VRCRGGEQTCSADGTRMLWCFDATGYLAASAWAPDDDHTCVRVGETPTWVLAPPQPCEARTHVETCWPDGRVVTCGPSGYEELAACPDGVRCVRARNGASGCWAE